MPKKPSNTNKLPARTVTNNQVQLSAIDIEQLTDKVYHLMLVDLRLERARGVSQSRRKGTSNG